MQSGAADLLCRTAARAWIRCVAVLILSACAPTGETPESKAEARDETSIDAQSAASADTQPIASIDAPPGSLADKQPTKAIGARDRVLGLLTLPQVFGTETCQPFTPTDVTLYASADSSQAIGRIHVETPWTIHPDGGCEGLAVKVHPTDADSVTELPALEHSYEAPAAIVLQRNGDWFRIRLAGGAAWIHATEQNRFHALEELLAESLTYVANPDGAGLAAAPGKDRSAAADLITAERPVNVLETQRVGEELWLRVAIQSHSACEVAGDPPTIAEGWLPAHSRIGEPIVWFYSRGC